MNNRQKLLSAISQIPDEDLSALLEVAERLLKEKNALEPVFISQGYQDWVSADNDIYDELFTNAVTTQ